MWSDKESDKDYLNFGEVAQIASEIIKNQDMLPVSIGVFGSWGAGKSSVLQLIEKELVEEKYIVIKFDAWLYQGYDDARMALMEKIASKLQEETKDNEDLLKKTTKLLSRINVIRVLGLAAEGISLFNGIPTGGLLYRGIQTFDSVKSGNLSKEDYENSKNFVKDANNTATSLLNPSNDNNTPPKEIDAFRTEYGEILYELKKTLVVVIDNLDRCIPKNAIQILESIRLFLFLNKTAFVIAADEDMIRVSVKEYFPLSSEKHQIDYLDKLIQIPIRVPKAGIREIRSYLFMLYAINHNLASEKLEKLRETLERNLRQSWKEKPITIKEILAVTKDEQNKELIKSYELAERIAPLLVNAPSIQGNPRIVKRLLNVIKMRSKIAQQRGMDLLDEAIITKFVIFERCAGQKETEYLYQIINSEEGKPAILKILEESPKNLKGKIPEIWIQNSKFILEWAQMKPYLSGIDLRSAVYLSRETTTIGVYAIDLSEQGKELLEALIILKNTSSPSIKHKFETFPSIEAIPLMEKVISQLRHVTDWTNKPDGFSGACLLADRYSTSSDLLVRFINDEIDVKNKNLPWLNSLLKDRKWYKGE